MFFAFLAIAVLALSFFTPESLVTTIVGFAVSTGLTQWFKDKVGAMGFAALVVAIAVSFVVAFVAVLISSFLGGGGVSWDTIPQYGMQIFMLSQLAYKGLLADPRS